MSVHVFSIVLLANRNSGVPTTSYLGGREGAKEREMEWARRHDREGENLLG